MRSVLLTGVVVVVLGASFGVAGAAEPGMEGVAAAGSSEGVEAGGIRGGVEVPATGLPEDLPAPEGGPEVTLGEAFALARARHPSLRSVGAELGRADGLLEQAWGALLPRISAGVSYQLADQETTVDFSGMLPDIPGLESPEPVVVRRQHVAQAQVSLQAPLFSMPIYSAVESAGLGREMAGLAAEEVERQLLMGVAVAWFGASAARELLELHQATYDAARERLRAAQVRLALGAGLAIDAARAELEVETARLDHEAAVLGYARAREALAGLLVQDELPVPREGEEVGAGPAPDDPDRLVEQALGERSDLAMRRLRVAMAEQGVWSAWAAFFPTVSAGFQYTAELTEPSGFGGRRHAWTLALTLAVPLYDQPRYGLLDQRRAEVLQAEADLEAAEWAVRTEVRTAWQEVRTARASLETAERQVGVAAEALRLVEAGRTNGAATGLEVDEARQRLNGARVRVAVQRYQARAALVRLLLLAGLPAA